MVRLPAPIAITAVLALSLLSTGCFGEPECEQRIPTYEACMQGVRTVEGADGIRRIIFGPSTGQQGGGSAAGGEATGSVQQPLVIDRARLWPSPKIPVCWDATTFSAEHEWQRAAVRDAVRNTWERAFDRPYIPQEKRIEFTGWGVCQPNEKGIRIRVADQRAYSHIGTDHLNFTNTEMVLNFTYREYSRGVCGKNRESMERCLRATAVHEFAHALGVHHEQDREDTPQACLDELDAEDRRAAEGLTDVDYYGAWDECSISNYCNPIWNNGGRLSLQDIMFIQLAYMPELANRQEWCRQLMFLETQGVDPNAASTTPAANTEAVSAERGVPATVPATSAPAAPGARAPAAR